MLKAGAAIASLIGIDIRRYICDKKDISNIGGDPTTINPHHCPHPNHCNSHLISDDINDITELSFAQGSFPKHATYHGTTKTSSRPLLSQALVGYTDNNVNKYPRHNSLTVDSCNNCNSLNSSNYLASLENHRKSSRTSIDSSDNLAQPNIDSLTCMTPRSQRHTSNSSIGSSNINPSFDPGEEEYDSRNCSIISQPKVLNNHQSKRPNTLNLQPFVINSGIPRNNRIASAYSSSSPFNRTPSPVHPKHRYNPVQNDRDHPDYVNTLSRPATGTIQTRVRSGIKSNHTLLDIPTEGQSQDGTIPLTALISDLCSEQLTLASEGRESLPAYRYQSDATRYRRFS